MNFHVTILGTSSALFGQGRFMTAQVLNANNNLYLIDCGEATQLQLLKYGIKSTRISNVFISHLHGDHYFGLLGLITSLSLKGRNTELHVHGPAGLKQIIDVNLEVSDTQLCYPLIFHEIEYPSTRVTIWEDDTLLVDAVPLSHRVHCTGFIFREKPKPRRIIGQKLPEGMPSETIELLKTGVDVEFDGQVYENEEMTRPPKPSRSYAFCTDTAYLPELAAMLTDVDLLYHESTYTKELTEKAAEVFHSTATQAATVAAKADVGHLLLGHYSIRYGDLKPFVQEAKMVFAHTSLGLDGGNYSLDIVDNERITLNKTVLPKKKEY